MLFPFAKKGNSAAAEVEALQNQLESAKRRITELTLENIQLANEVAQLKDYRGTPAPQPARSILATVKEMTAPPIAANTEIGRLFSVGAV